MNKLNNNTSTLSQSTFESKNYKNEITNDENEANLDKSENDIFSSPVTSYLPKIYENSNHETQSQPNLGFNSYHIEQQQTFINKAVIPNNETRFSFTLYPKNEEDQNTRFSFTLFPSQEKQNNNYSQKNQYLSTYKNKNVSKIQNFNDERINKLEDDAHSLKDQHKEIYDKLNELSG